MVPAHARQQWKSNKIGFVYLVKSRCDKNNVNQVREGCLLTRYPTTSLTQRKDGGYDCDEHKNDSGKVCDLCPFAERHE
jgi:hypothetical protein